ncbi:hypothetical protein SEA_MKALIMITINIS3_53 [Mycobacterium phage MkaliMitinis3]|nr:hypothetical protein SEA_MKALIMITINIS3_53 [Mycobacterium phage MkaliMitinis3]
MLSRIKPGDIRFLAVCVIVIAVCVIGLAILGKITLPRWGAHT